MTDLLEQGAAWLDEQRHQHLTRTVTYERGASSIEVQATVGQTVFRLNDDFGATIREVSRDYLIRTADLVLDGEPTQPQRGDRIREEVSGFVYVHEVMAPGGEPEWRYSDPQRNTLRIHTKQIDQEPAL